jgi:two-component system, chemotaxis family, chemotaxis protein CheV
MTKHFTGTKPVLEVGSNLFELIEFTLTSESKPMLFAVNVAKVREVIRLPPYSSAMSQSDGILGIFNLRGSPVPLIHLTKVVGLLPSNFQASPETIQGQVIVTEFTGKVAGFLVDSARRIRRVGWDKVLPPATESFKWATGMMFVEPNDFIFILDFEKILSKIENQGDTQDDAQGKPALSFTQNERNETTQFGSKTILVVDDSSTARRAVCEMLRPHGYRIVEFSNGASALEFMQKQNSLAETLMISDVEMPQLDGYSLVMRIHEIERFKNFPIILHSSLSGEVNVERAKKSGSACYVSKFNKREIIEAVSKIFLLLEKSKEIVWGAIA